MKANLDTFVDNFKEANLNMKDFKVLVEKEKKDVLNTADAIA